MVVCIGGYHPIAEPYLKILANKIANLELKISPEVLLECKHFFSGAALYADGKICASLGPVGLGLKLPAEVRDQLIERGEAGELRYFEKSPVKKAYVLFQESIVEAAGRLARLLETSVECVTA